MPVSEENEHVLKLGKNAKKSAHQSGEATPKGEEDIAVEANSGREFKLLGFTDQKSVPRHHFMGGVDVILPVKG